MSRNMPKVTQHVRGGARTGLQSPGSDCYSLWVPGTFLLILLCLVPWRLTSQTQSSPFTKTKKGSIIASD